MIPVVTLRSRITQLRPIVASDAKVLVNWRNDPSSMHLWTIRRALVDEERALQEIGDDLQTDKHVWLMAENRHEQTVGMVYSYNAQFVDQHCFSTTYVSSDFRSRGHGPEMQALFLNYLFTYFNFQKVYYDVYGYNTLSRSTITTFGFKEEGNFPEHRYFNGEWHALIRYAVYREDLERIREFLVRRTPKSS